MNQSLWRLQDAKARFSQVVEAALQGEPQHLSRRGREAVVVLSAANYRTLQEAARAGAPGFVAHLLAIPKVPKRSATDAVTRRGAKGRSEPILRDVEF